MVATNSKGRILAVQIFKKFIDVSEAAEAFAILKAIQLALEEGWMTICCVSDVKIVIQCLVNDNPLLATGPPNDLFVLLLGHLFLWTVFDFVGLQRATIVLPTVFVNGVLSTRLAVLFPLMLCLALL